MKKNNACNICTSPFRGFVLNNKLVCMRCDELTFDLEIECDEEPVLSEAPTAGKSKPAMTINLPKK